MTKGFTDAQAALDFMFAGKATITLSSSATGTRFTYRITRKKPGSELDDTPYFVAVLSGPNNDADYTYIGYIKAEYDGAPKSGLLPGRKGRPDTPSFNAFTWAFAWLRIRGEIKDGLEIHHEGRCGRCNRTLTVPESIESGFGSECSKIMEG